MDIRYDSYRAFYYAAKYQNITRAAQFLLCNQSNLTRTIKGLEDALGCRLFLRSNRGVVLTPEGEGLYSHIAQAMEHIRAGEEELAAARRLEGGLVRIASSEIALRCCLLPVLQRFRKQHPGVRLQIANHTTPQALEALKNGLADFAAVTAPPELPGALDCRTHADIQEVPFGGGDLSFLASETRTLEDLTAYPLIGLGSRTLSFSFFSGLFLERGLLFRPEIEAGTADQVPPLVRAGLGIGFLPENFDNPEGIRPIPLDPPIPKRSICLLKRKSSLLSIAARELERVLQEACPASPPEA